MGNRLRMSAVPKVTLALAGLLALALAVPPADAGPGGIARAADAVAPVPVEEMHELKIDRRTVVAATAPSQVTTGQVIGIRGMAQVRGGRSARPRPVKLFERRHGHWAKAGTRRTTRTGGFVFRVAGKRAAGVRTFRVQIPRSKGLRAGKTSILRVRVVRTTTNSSSAVNVPTLAPTPDGSFDPPAAIPAEPAPQGVSTDWTWLYAPGGGRWNPCSVISWGYYPFRGYAGAVDDIKEAFARISARTGLMFRYAGTVDTAPGPGMVAVPGVDIVVGWSNAGRVSQLSGAVVGLASAVATSTSVNADVGWRLVRGWVALDADEALRQGYDVSGWPTWGQVMVHETLHVLGLGHASSQTQVMYGAVNSLNHRFGAGDLTGMARVGATHGCLG